MKSKLKIKQVNKLRLKMYKMTVVSLAGRVINTQARKKFQQTFSIIDRLSR